MKRGRGITRVVSDSLSRAGDSLSSPSTGPQDSGNIPTTPTAAAYSGSTTTTPSTGQQTSPRSDAPRPTRPSRGRGILSQLSAGSTRPAHKPVETEVEPPPRAISPAADSEQSTSSSSHRLSRQGSDVSKNSLVTEQFAEIPINVYKAKIDKTPSTWGQPVTMSVNYMTFETSNQSPIQEYHVEFSPDIESIALRYRLLRSPEAQQITGPVIHWTGTNLYLPIKLDRNKSTFTTEHPASQETITVNLIFVKTPPDDELLPFYNSLMHRVLNRLNYITINRHQYSPLHKISVRQHNLEVWPGWITSIQRLDGGLKLTVDSSFRVLRLETVRDLLIHIKDQRPANLREAFEAHLVGTIVMTSYNNRPYRIDGIDLTKKPSDTFTQVKNGVESQVSYVDYMRTHWNVEVRDQHQPMIIHRPKQRRGQESDEVLYLIPELCCTTGLTDDMRANFNIMKAIAEHTRLPPDVREDKLGEFLKQISTDERAKSVLDAWNLSVSLNPDVLTGRRIEPETIILGNNRQVVVPDNADWTRPATSGAVYKSVDINDWVFMHVEKDSNVAEEVLNSLKEVSRYLNIKFCRPRIIKLPDDRSATYINYAKREVKPTDQMVVFLTPGKTQREDRYSACKRLLSCEFAVPCQFLRAGVVGDPRKMRSVVQKVIVQMLSKVGGQPWAMKFPMKRFMIVGIDVYHETADRRKSCLALVASMNETSSSWWSRVFFQGSLEEIGQKLKATFSSAIARFHKLNGCIPERIICYRDGVGDSQLDTVVNVEVAQVMDAIRFYLRDSNLEIEMPKLSYVVVQKRINAKLTLRDRGRLCNPQPGSFLDHTITHPEYNDFYLVSQHVNQGTVSPTKYVILTETGVLKPAHHQKLAYKMTHMYYNWCGTIRVPAPCQYAHKLAYLAGQNIRQQVSEKLEDRLYYL